MQGVVEPPLLLASAENGSSCYMAANPLSAARMMRGSNCLPLRPLGVDDRAAAATDGAASEGWSEDSEGRHMIDDEEGRLMRDLL